MGVDVVAWLESKEGETWSQYRHLVPGSLSGFQWLAFSHAVFADVKNQQVDYWGDSFSYHFSADITDWTYKDLRPFTEWAHP